MRPADPSAPCGLPRARNAVTTVRVSDELPNVTRRAGHIVGLVIGAPDVDRMCDGFEMIRAAASGIPAEMVDLETFRDGADQRLEDNAMNVEHDLRGIAPSQADIQRPVSLADRPAGPLPTALRMADHPCQNPPLRKRDSLIRRHVLKSGRSPSHNGDNTRRRF